MITPEIQKLLHKINKKSIQLCEIANVNNGILAYEVGAGIPKQTAKIRDKRLYHSDKKHSKEWIKYVDGVDVQRYFLDWSGQFVKYGKNLARRRKKEFWCDKFLRLHHTQFYHVILPKILLMIITVW